MNIELKITEIKWYHKLFDIFRSSKPLIGGSTVIVPVTIAANGKVQTTVIVPRKLIKQDNPDVIRGEVERGDNPTIIGETEAQKSANGTRERTASGNLIRPIAITSRKENTIYLQDPYSNKKFYINLDEHKEAVENL